jgi:hypothetical protein
MSSWNAAIIGPIPENTPCKARGNPILKFWTLDKLISLSRGHNSREKRKRIRQLPKNPNDNSGLKKGLSPTC